MRDFMVSERKDICWFSVFLVFPRMGFSYCVCIYDIMSHGKPQ